MNWYYQLNNDRNWIKVWKDEQDVIQREPADFNLAGNWQPGDIIEITHHPPIPQVDSKQCCNEASRMMYGKCQECNQEPTTRVLFKPPPLPSYKNVKNKTLEEMIEELSKLPTPIFKPNTHYNAWSPKGMLEIFWKDADYYIDHDKDNKHLSYCRDFKTEEIVGIVIENIADLKLK